MFGDAHPATSRAVQLEKRAKRVSARLGWCARKIAFKAPVLRCNAGRGTLRFCNNHAKPEPDRDNIWVQVCPLENDCIHFSSHYAVRNCAETDLPTGAARKPICRLFQNGTAANNTVNRGKKVRAIRAKSEPNLLSGATLPLRHLKAASRTRPILMPCRRKLCRWRSWAR
jgi:hypothetical protein